MLPGTGSEKWGLTFTGCFVGIAFVDVIFSVFYGEKCVCVCVCVCECECVCACKHTCESVKEA